jgi:hypothetical protein
MRELWVPSPGAVRARAILSGAIDLLTDAEAAEFEHLQTHIPELDDVGRLKPAQAQPNPEARAPDVGDPHRRRTDLELTTPFSRIELGAVK